MTIRPTVTTLPPLLALADLIILPVYQDLKLPSSLPKGSVVQIQDRLEQVDFKGGWFME